MQEYEELMMALATAAAEGKQMSAILPTTDAERANPLYPLIEACCTGLAKITGSEWHATTTNAYNVPVWFLLSDAGHLLAAPQPGNPKSLLLFYSAYQLRDMRKHMPSMKPGNTTKAIARFFEQPMTPSVVNDIMVRAGSVLRAEMGRVQVETASEHLTNALLDSGVVSESSGDFRTINDDAIVKRMHVGPFAEVHLFVAISTITPERPNGIERACIKVKGIAQVHRHEIARSIAASVETQVEFDTSLCTIASVVAAYREICGEVDQMGVQSAPAQE